MRRSRFLPLKALAASVFCTVGMLACLPVLSLFLYVSTYSGDVRLR